MSNIHNEKELEQIHEYIIKKDNEGSAIVDDDINGTAREHNLHPDDDREEVIQILAEYIFEERHA